MELFEQIRREHEFGGERSVAVVFEFIAHRYPLWVAIGIVFFVADNLKSKA